MIKSNLFNHLHEGNEQKYNAISICPHAKNIDVNFESNSRFNIEYFSKANIDFNIYFFTNMQYYA